MKTFIAAFQNLREKGRNKCLVNESSSIQSLNINVPTFVASARRSYQAPKKADQKAVRSYARLHNLPTCNESLFIFNERVISKKYQLKVSSFEKKIVNK